MWLLAPVSKYQDCYLLLAPRMPRVMFHLLRLYFQHNWTALQHYYSYTSIQNAQVWDNYNINLRFIMSSTIISSFSSSLRILSSSSSRTIWVLINPFIVGWILRIYTSSSLTSFTSSSSLAPTVLLLIFFKRKTYFTRCYFFFNNLSLWACMMPTTSSIIISSKFLRLFDFQNSKIEFFM